MFMPTIIREIKDDTLLLSYELSYQLVLCDNLTGNEQNANSQRNRTLWLLLFSIVFESFKYPQPHLQPLCYKYYYVPVTPLFSCYLVIQLRLALHPYQA